MNVLDIEVVQLAPVRAQPLTGPVRGRCILFGYSLRETSGAAVATVQFLNGADATGLEVAGIQLQPSGATRDWFGPQGIDTDVGIWPVVTGAVAGAFYAWIPRPGDHIHHGMRY